MSSRILNLVGTAALCVAGNAWAGIITQNATGTSATIGTGFFEGQSVTTPTGGPWDDLGFNFVQCGNPSGTSCLAGTSSPYALGDLYLLTQIYDGLPSGLSSSTPGFVAEATTITGGVWTFASSVTLNPSTQYFFYMDTAFSGVEDVYSNSDPYAGGQAYGANTGNGPTYGSDDSPLVGVDQVFSLTGDSTGSTVPEPGLGALTGLVLAGLVGALTLRRRACKA
jgi:hypothetical protein